MWRRAGGRLVALGRFPPLASAPGPWAASGSGYQLECGIADGQKAIASLAGMGLAAPSRILRSDKLTDEFGIATGLEREELEFKKQGKSRFELEPPRGPFGTSENPAIVQSHFDERIVGCPGGPGDDEHDVVWFKLKKNERYECPVCAQVFELEVVGPGGPAGGHHH